MINHGRPRNGALNALIANGVLYTHKEFLELDRRARDLRTSEDAQRLLGEIRALHRIADEAGDSATGQSLARAWKRLRAVGAPGVAERADDIARIKAAQAVVSDRGLRRKYIVQTEQYRRRGGAWKDARVVVRPKRDVSPDQAVADPAFVAVADIIGEAGARLRPLRRRDGTVGGWVSYVAARTLARICHGLKTGRIAPTRISLSRSSFLLPTLSTGIAPRFRHIAEVPVRTAMRADPLGGVPNSEDEVLMSAVGHLLSPMGQRRALVVRRKDGQSRPERVFDHARKYVMTTRGARLVALTGNGDDGAGRKPSPSSPMRARVDSEDGPHTLG